MIGHDRRLVRKVILLDNVPFSWYVKYQPVGIQIIPTETKLESRHESKNRFLNAAVHVIRAKGYSATRIEDICEAAGLTKGSFFHHFDSKEALRTSPGHLKSFSN
jgi:TetR/AcrR family transcriptional repressor of nem operon